MCDHPNREAAMVVVREGTPERLGRDGVWCDPCLVPLITALNDGGLPTVASCCGHGVAPRGRVSLADGRELFIVPTFEAASALDDLLAASPVGRATPDGGALDASAFSDDTGRVAAAIEGCTASVVEGRVAHIHRCYAEGIARVAVAALTGPADTDGDDELRARVEALATDMTSMYRETLVAIDNCPESNVSDYYRWHGRAEHQRQTIDTLRAALAEGDSR